MKQKLRTGLIRYSAILCNALGLILLIKTSEPAYAVLGCLSLAVSAYALTELEGAITL